MNSKQALRNERLNVKCGGRAREIAPEPVFTEYGCSHLSSETVQTKQWTRQPLPWQST